MMTTAVKFDDSVYTANLDNADSANSSSGAVFDETRCLYWTAIPTGFSNAPSTGTGTSEADKAGAEADKDKDKDKSKAEMVDGVTGLGLFRVHESSTPLLRTTVTLTAATTTAVVAATGVATHGEVVREGTKVSEGAEEMTEVVATRPAGIARSELVALYYDVQNSLEEINEKSGQRAGAVKEAEAVPMVMARRRIKPAPYEEYTRAKALLYSNFLGGGWDMVY
jgi:hypothetical protein